MWRGRGRGRVRLSGPVLRPRPSRRRRAPRTATHALIRAAVAGATSARPQPAARAPAPAPAPRRPANGTLCVKPAAARGRRTGSAAAARARLGPKLRPKPGVCGRSGGGSSESAGLQPRRPRAAAGGPQRPRGRGDRPRRAPAAHPPRRGRPRNLRPNFPPGLLRPDGGPLSWPQHPAERRPGQRAPRVQPGPSHGPRAPAGAPGRRGASPRGPRPAPLACPPSAPGPAPRTRGKVGLEPARPVPPGRADRPQEVAAKLFLGVQPVPPARRDRMRTG